MVLLETKSHYLPRYYSFVPFSENPWISLIPTSRRRRSSRVLTILSYSKLQDKLFTLWANHASYWKYTLVSHHSSDSTNNRWKSFHSHDVWCFIRCCYTILEKTLNSALFSHAFTHYWNQTYEEHQAETRCPKESRGRRSVWNWSSGLCKNSLRVSLQNKARLVLDRWLSWLCYWI